MIVSPRALGLVLGAVMAAASPRALSPQDPPVRPGGDTLPARLAAARVVGRVTDTTGAPVPGAEVAVVGWASLRTVSGDSGAFRLDGVPTGSVTFAVRRLGFESATFSAVLRPGRTHGVTMALTPIAQALPGVAVQERRDDRWLSIFEARRSRRMGTFITRAQIEKLQARGAADILRIVPGLEISPGRQGMSGSRVSTSRGDGAKRCVPRLFVHLVQYSGTIDDFSADDIEAIEVYVGVSQIPPDLNSFGQPMCAAIVLWTREPPEKGKP